MMCYIYCASVLEWFFFASAPILFLISLFVFKRGIIQKRLRLRQLAFFMMFISAIKVFVVDVYLAHRSILCSTGALDFACNITGFRVFGLLSLLMLLGCSFLLFVVYRSSINDWKISYKTFEQVNLRAWANTSMVLVSVFILWLIVPWGHYLIIGDMSIFSIFSLWGTLAFLSMASILRGFWKYEECSKDVDIQHNKHTADAWKPKDTLWLAFFLLIITIGFALATDDVLMKSGFDYIR